MKFVKELAKEIKDEKEIGGKGAQLYQLIKKGYNVPEAIVVLKTAYLAFLKYNNLGGLA